MNGEMFIHHQAKQNLHLPYNKRPALQFEFSVGYFHGHVNKLSNADFSMNSQFEDVHA